MFYLNLAQYSTRLTAILVWHFMLDLQENHQHINFTLPGLTAAAARGGSGSQNVSSVCFDRIIGSIGGSVGQSISASDVDFGTGQLEELDGGQTRAATEEAGHEVELQQISTS